MRISGRFLTAANMISIARIPLSGLACLFMASGNSILAGVFIFAAVATDTLDGTVARATDTVSDWGRILDPLADKIGIIAFVLTLFFLGRIYVWFVVAIIVRDVLIGSVGLFLAGKLTSPPSSNIWGKLSSLLVSLYLVRQALWPALQWPGDILPGADFLGTAAFGMAVLSLIIYATETIGVLKNANDS